MCLNKFLHVLLEFSSMGRTGETYHALQNEEPLFFIEYFEKIVSKWLIIAGIVIGYESLQILVILLLTESVFHLSNVKIN